MKTEREFNEMKNYYKNMDKWNEACSLTLFFIGFIGGSLAAFSSII